MKFKEMHQINLRYQLVVYGDYNEVIPSAENVQFFVNEFADKSFIPSIFQQLRFNSSNLGMKNETVNRIALTSQDQTWLVKFNTDKIDISLTNGLLDENFLSSDDFTNQSIDILQKIAKKFPKKYNRIGFITQTLTREIDPKATFGLFNKSLEYIDSAVPTQWNNKFAFRKLIEIEDKKEIVNINTDLGWGKAGLNQNNKFIEFEGLLMGLDINTLFEEKTSRYNVSNVELFINRVLAHEKQIRSDLNKRINIS